MKSKTPKLILIAGASGSGKTTVAREINNSLITNGVTSQIVCLDNFYKENISNIKEFLIKGIVNYDHPNAFDWQEIEFVVNQLLQQEEVEMAEYNYATHKRSRIKTKIKPTDVIILEGILSIHNEQINNLAVIKIFVDTPADECFIRRLKRDVSDRNRTIDSVIEQWRVVVSPMHDFYVLPQKAVSDLIVPWYKHNEASLDLICNGIATQILKNK